jgi:Leucine-rich repeat (LRR) protein
MRQARWLNVVLLCIAAYGGVEGPDSHIVHFPSNRSMGTLYVLHRNQVDTSSTSNWEFFYQATGDVTVPAGKVLRLDLSKEAVDDLTSLSALMPNDLVMLNLKGIEMTDDQLQHIAPLTNLRELDLSETGILGTGLKHLAGLKSLKKLWLDNTHVGDNELAHLLDLPPLQGLGLRGTPTTDAGMIHVGKLVSLATLSLSAGVGDEGLARLKKLTELRWLSAGDRGITDEGLVHLAGLTQMEDLHLDGAQVSDASLVYLKQVTKLKTLSLYGTRVTERGFIHLEGLQNLENLQVLFGVTDTGLMHLSKLPSLKNITIRGDSITAKGLAILSKMNSLKHVYVDNTDKMDAITGEITRLTGINELTLGTGLTDEGLMKLKNMPSLQKLTIGPSRITGEGIAALAAIPSLQVLQLYQARLDSEEDWAALGRLSVLRRLSLRHTRSQVTDAHIEHLSGLQSLQELSIDAIIIKDRNATYSMDVTDGGLGHLCKLKSLEHLTLRGAKLTDEGVQQLSQISTLRTCISQTAKLPSRASSG